LFLAFLFCRNKVISAFTIRKRGKFSGGNMALMHLTIIPLGTGSASVGGYIAEIQDAIEKSGYLYKLTDMGTIIEGNSKELLALAAQLSELPFNQGVHRVLTQINLDDRRDKKVSLGDKMASVVARLA
jgi:uncharacterized protein (TIGR00106 family)